MNYHYEKQRFDEGDGSNNGLIIISGRTSHLD
jgi:hypothetical protein